MDIYVTSGIFFIGLLVGAIGALIIAKYHFDKFIESLPTIKELEKLRQSLGGP